LHGAICGIIADSDPVGEAAMAIRDVVAALLFAMVYGFRLLYQAYLLRHRDTSGTKGDRSELLLVVIPKNILVPLAIIYLARGLAWGALFFIGWAVFLSGIALRIAALHQLGPMYSLNVDIRSRHELVTGGLYSIVRHPLYVAYVVDTLGIVMFLQRWYFVPVLVASIVGWAIRVPREERALARVFGSAYDDYRSRVPSVNIFVGVSRSLKHWLLDSSERRKAPDAHTGPSKHDIGGPGKTSYLSDADKCEIEIHLAEYRALSDFQRDAKATFVRIAIYHNTGIVVVVTWVLQNYGTPNGVVSVLLKAGYFYPLLFALPVLNSVLIVASAYQAYSFFCVALHFARMRQRLRDLVGNEVLAYEDKFGSLLGRQKQLSMLLDVAAAAMWFMIPALLAAAIAYIGASGAGIVNGALCRCSYWIGTASSLAALFYLAGLVILIRRIGSSRAQHPKDRAPRAAP
jgi:protein-S-isoprenylcysteine O-methyltransferase Ste14